MSLTESNLKRLRRDLRRQKRREAEERARQAEQEQEQERQAQLARDQAEERAAHRSAYLRSLRAEKTRFYLRVGASFLPAAELGFSRKCGGNET
eukprot:269261-Pleurochrysis_carterae.AAC.1